MLAKAAARSLQLAAIRPPIQAALPSFQSRSYAKHSKPTESFRYKPPTSLSSSTSHEVNTQRPTQPLDFVTRRHPDKLPPDTQPQSNIPFDIPTETSSHSDISKLQDETYTTRPTASNIEPQSIPPSAVDPARSRNEGEEHEPTRPLPDLTQGIPSTIDAEISASSQAIASKGLNITEALNAPGGQGGGDLPKSAYISSLERRRNRVANYFFGTAALSVILGAVYLGRNWDNEEEELAHSQAPSGWGLRLFWNRVLARTNKTLDYYNEPTFPTLLPTLEPAFERPYTLVLSLEDLLVHSEWTRQNGWRMAKRPGVDYFLRYLSQYYELVVFTSQPSMIAGPIIQKLDPYQVIMWPLFREATRYRGNEYIKDLSFLNRDLSKVILMDTNASHAKLQPENAVIIPKWKGDPNDKGLVSFIPFLEFVGADVDMSGKGSRDTREVLKSFEGKDIPTEFARREALHREKFMEELEEKRGKRPRRSPGVLGSLLGAKPQTMDGLESLSEAFDQGKTYYDLVRERGQKQYEVLEKHLRENGEEMLRERAEEEKKMQDEAMKGMKSNMTNYLPFVGGGSKQS